LGEGGRRREGLVRAVESVLGAAKAREVVQVGEWVGGKGMFAV
jgi:hypothetical protein